MDKRSFRRLWQRYLSNKVTNEEKQFLENYYDLFEGEKNIFNHLSYEEKTDLEKDLEVRIWNKIEDQGTGEEKIRRLRTAFVRVAAAVVFMGIIGSLFYLYYRSDKLRPDNAVVQKNNLKQVPAENTGHSLRQKENTVIFLPDGSTVYLSPGSRLNYPSTFDEKKKREVYLEGQGFFDIKHNPSKPFIVHSGQVTTTVLGTAFNIKAQPSEKYITVTVKRGRVSVSDSNKTLGVLTPREQVTFNTYAHTSKITKVQDDSYLDWKNSDLFINNLTLAEAARLLEEQYKIKIIIKDPSMQELRFTATFPKNETLEVAVKSISEFNGLNYSFNKDKTIVTISR